MSVVRIQQDALADVQKFYRFSTEHVCCKVYQYTVNCDYGHETFKPPSFMLQVLL